MVNMHLKIQRSGAQPLAAAVAVAEAEVARLKAEESRVAALHTVATVKPAHREEPFVAAYAPYGGAEGSVEQSVKAMMEKK